MQIPRELIEDALADTGLMLWQGNVRDNYTVPHTVAAMPGIEETCLAVDMPQMNDALLFMTHLGAQELDRNALTVATDFPMGDLVKGVVYFPGTSLK